MVRAHARGGHRGDPRRRLQPHRRGQPPGAHDRVPRHRQLRVLPPRGEGPPVLHRLHRHRELAERAEPALAAADHGQPALLGHRDARRRVPLRPRGDPRPGVLRRRPAVELLRPRAAGSRGLAGEAHRRAVGRRPRRLPGRQLPAAVVGVERQVPRRGAGLLARRAVEPRRVRVAHHGIVRPVREQRPAPGGLDQLRHRARRLHAPRPRLVQREAQRGERRGRQRRGIAQPVVELGRRGRDRRSRRAHAARPPAAQLPRHAAALAGRADAAARRRARPHAAGQQQHVRAGQRAQLGALGRRRPAAHRVHRRGRAAAQGPPHLPAQPVLRRASGRERRGPRGAAARHRVAAARRHADAARRTGMRRSAAPSACS